jgi:Fic family protein
VFQPVFGIGPKTAKALMRIEACREAVESLPLTVTLLESLRSSARLLSTHYSTRIEGNRLSPNQVKEVLRGGGPFPGRERDVREVLHYHHALEYMERVAREPRPVTESVVRTLHGLVEHGRRKPTPYRDGQNAIRHSRTGAMVYLPPEAKDVHGLMKELCSWIRNTLAQGELPVPVLAALAHYQFATIHPYYDGNGRTARLLTTLLLHRGGYGLRGIYSLEEYYAKNLEGYYAALKVGKSHNYYFGRAKADCSGFVEYFCLGMAESFEAVRAQAREAGKPGVPDDSPRLRGLDRIQRSVLGLFRKQQQVSSAELGAYLQLAPRNAGNLAAKWIAAGFLELADASRKMRKYRLAPDYEALVADGM